MNKLAKLDFKRKKKSWRLLMSVMILAYAFIPIVSVFFASLDRTKEVKREMTYGSWHVALIGADEETIDDLKNHATVESAGISQTYGMVLDTNNEELAKIGTVDENTIKMENINLMEGHFPKHEGEVAIEMSSLTAMGYSNSIGQTISIPIRVKVRKDTKIVELDYTVVGIVQDYSTKLKGTTPDKRDYVSFFVSDKDEVKQYQSVGNFVCRLKKEFLKTDKELLQVKGKYASLLTNNYTYFELGKESNHQLKVTNKQRRVILFASILVITLVASASFINYKKDQQANSSLLFKIGRDISNINRLMIREIVLITCAALIVGCGIGNIIILIGIGAVKMLTKNSISLVFPIRSIIIWELIAVSALTIANILCISKKAKYMDISRKRKAKKTFEQEVYLKNKALKKFINKALHHDIKIRCIYSFCIVLMLCSSTFNIYDSMNNSEVVNDDNIQDYNMGMSHSYYPLQMSLDNDVYEQIGKVYGIKYIEAYKSNNYLPASWNGIENSGYVEKLKDFFWPQYTNSKETQVFVLGIDPNGEAYDFYINSIQNGMVDEKKFKNGEIALLYAPKFNVNSIGYIQFEADGKYYEDTIKVGDVLQVKGGQGVEEVEIGGIANTMIDSASIGNSTKPLVVIGSYALCDRLALDGKHPTFEYLAISTLDNINYHQTTSEMYNIGEISKNYIVNNLEKKQSYKNRFYEIISICTLIDVISILTIVIIVWGRRAFAKKKYDKLLILRYLGMSKVRYFGYKCKTSMIASCFGVITGVISAVIIQIVIYIRELNFDPDFGWIEEIKMAIGIVDMRIPREMWLTICLLFAVTSCGFSYVFAKKNLKKLKM